MNIKDEFSEMVREITTNKEKTYNITTRDLLGYFYYEKRSSGNTARIDEFLKEKNLVTEPNYQETWIDGEITLKHKETAKSKLGKDPILKISILPSANNIPITITRDAKITEAITLMMMKNFSQLPVMSGQKSVVGFISWETLAIGISNGKTSSDVKDYLKTDFTILQKDTPLLEAIKIVIKEEVVLVQEKDKSLCGIVTIADISSQFFSLTEPFLLLERIENLIRLLLDGKFLIEDIKGICQQGEEEPKFIDDLTFGQYIRLIENEEGWNKLGLKIERKLFIKQLDEIRKTRNDVMHFDTDGITDKQRNDLVNMANLLTSLVKLTFE